MLGEATVHRILRWILAFCSRASSQSFYTTDVYIIVGLLSHALLPDRCFPVFWSLSLPILSSPADPPTFRNPIKLSIRLRILLLAPRMFWTHGSAAASAKRTEIRRAVSTPWSALRRFEPWLLLSQAQAVTCLKTTRYKTRRL